MEAKRRLAALGAIFAVAATLLAAPGTALAARDIPVGGANVNDQNLSSSSYRYAIRFVLDQDTTLYRFVSGFKAQGASWWPGENGCSAPGSGCYGAGSGGTVNARLVTVKADGTPDLGNVLAEETFGAQARYFESAGFIGLSGGTINQLWYVNAGGARLQGNRMYAMVYRNVASDTTHNFFSTNSPDMKESAAGPNGRNNLDPNAPGAVAGLDAREAVAWSSDSGANWTWGRQVGHYFGSASSDDGTRIPWYGYQSSAFAPYTPVQPYYNYWVQCSGCTLTLSGSPRAVTLTEAGGYAPSGSSVGVVTVKNLRTGQTGTTASLGGGMARGTLSPPVAIAVGDSYTVKVSGTVFKNPADTMIQATFGIGGSRFPFTTGGSNDRAEAFALPHPWYGTQSGSAGGGGGSGGSGGSDDAPTAGVAQTAATGTPVGSSEGSGPSGGSGSPDPLTGDYASIVTSTDGLLGYWRLADARGSVATASAGGPDGTYGKGVALHRPGLLDGDADRGMVNRKASSTSRLALGTGFNFADREDFSLEAWVSPASLDHVSRRIFDRLFERYGRTQEYYVMATDRRLSFGRVKADRYDTATRSAPLQVGRRYHVVATYDGTTMRLYLNGAVVAKARSTQRLARGPAVLTVGAKSGGTGNFSGTIDDVAVYGAALPAATVAAHYRAGAGS